MQFEQATRCLGNAQAKAEAAGAGFAAAYEGFCGVGVQAAEGQKPAELLPLPAVATTQQAFCQLATEEQAANVEVVRLASEAQAAGGALATTEALGSADTATTAQAMLTTATARAEAAASVLAAAVAKQGRLRGLAGLAFEAQTTKATAVATATTVVTAHRALADAEAKAADANGAVATSNGAVADVTADWIQRQATPSLTAC